MIYWIGNYLLKKTLLKHLILRIIHLLLSPYEEHMFTGSMHCDIENLAQYLTPHNAGAGLSVPCCDWADDINAAYLETFISMIGTLKC